MTVSKRRRPPPDGGPGPAFQRAGLAVFDDVLAPDDFAALQAFCNAADYVGVHGEGVAKVWRLGDGEPLRSHTWYHMPKPRGSRPPEERARFTAPTGTALDRFFAALSERFAAMAPLVGDAGRDWHTVSSCPFIYPRGTTLSLHQDGEAYSGAYVYYLHPRWKIGWGGHLIVLDPLGRDGAVAALHPPWLDDALDEPYVDDTGIAACVFPKTKRLVVLAPNLPHLITRVDPNAGDQPRVSLAGFFERG